ncbi:hypothetical protein [Paracidovorax avenae]|uniref:hypothetical protein n=1 Tax=Paracidovorax avenae TaxID=80867 RepID=UPI0013147C71|nr:hypothetical protein [Paracidovorax avenae]
MAHRIGQTGADDQSIDAIAAGFSNASPQIFHSFVAFFSADNLHGHIEGPIFESQAILLKGLLMEIGCFNEIHIPIYNSIFSSSNVNQGIYISNRHVETNTINLRWRQVAASITTKSDHCRAAEVIQSRLPSNGVPGGNT